MRLAALALTLAALVGAAPARADDKVKSSASWIAGGAGLPFWAPDGRGVDVALVDSGVVPVHSLAGNVVFGPDFSSERDDRNLRNLDTFGHGTHLAGLIAGRDAVTGFAGVAPRARLAVTNCATPSSIPAARVSMSGAVS